MRPAVKSSIELINTVGKRVKMQEVAVQHGREGKVIRKRFYYDTKQN